MIHQNSKKDKNWAASLNVYGGESTCLHVCIFVCAVGYLCSASGFRGESVSEQGNL